jgi:hypothetical protein
MVNDNEILEFINFIEKYDKSKSYSFRNVNFCFSIDFLDLNLIVLRKYGVNNEINMNITNANYVIDYKKYWPDWTVRDIHKRRIGKETVNLTGDYNVFLEHLTLLKLQN